MNRKKALITFISYFLFQFLISSIIYLFVTILYGSLKDGITETISTNLMILSTLISDTIFVLIIGFLNKEYIKNTIKLFKKKYLMYSVGGYVVYIISIQIYSICLEIFKIAPPSESANQLAIESMMSTVSPVFMFFMIVVFAPIIEEIVFRSSLMSLISGKERRSKILNILAMLASTFIFAAIHMTTELFNNQPLFETILTTIPYAILSAIMVGIYVRSNYNVASSMFFHAVNNFIAFITIIAIK